MKQQLESHQPIRHNFFVLIALLMPGPLAAQTLPQLKHAEELGPWTHFSLSPDEKVIAALHYETAALYHAPTGRLLRVDETKNVVDIRFSKLGSLLILSGEELILYDSTGTVAIKRFALSPSSNSEKENSDENSSDRFEAASFSPDGDKLAAVTKLGNIFEFKLTKNLVQSHKKHHF